MIKKLIPRPIKDLILYFLFFLRRIYNYGINFSNKSIKDAVVLSDNSNPTFFGYHDKTPFSADGSKILAMSITADDTKSKNECSQMKLGYFKKNKDGLFKNNFTPFAYTNTWCWQQGCMLQWYPLSTNKQVVFNTLVDGKYGAAIFDLESDRYVKKYKAPIYSISPTGDYAVTLNFSRLGRLRPGYGYCLLYDQTEGLNAPKNDGLYLMELKTGDKKLVVSIAELASNYGNYSGEHYINHATFSPNGRKIVFFHLWKKGRGRGLRVCMYDLATKIWEEVESQRTISHYCWKDNDSILTTNVDQSKKWRYSLYTLNSPIKRDDLLLDLTGDGHPMFHPTNNNYIITDTYPDNKRDQYLIIANLNTRSKYKIASFYSSYRYRGQVRCDLHPRWDRKGDYTLIDSTNFGKRKMILFKPSLFN